MLKKYSFSLTIAVITSCIITAFVSLLIFYLGSYQPIISIAVFLISFFTIWITIIIKTANVDRKIRKLYHNVFNLKRYKEASIPEYIDEISEQVTLLSQQKVKEIDVLTERENYRREFLGNVSHELKTPLFSIQGFLLTLIEGGVEDEKIRYKYLNRINKSVDRLGYIVKDLDMISELESGKIQIAPKSFNIVAVTQEVFDLLEIKAQKQGITLQFDEEYNNIKVIGDLERIQQVMVNLVVNAIKHSNKDNTTVTVSFKNENQNIQIAVHDNGQGISQEDQQRIFERFYRVDKSRNRKKGGSGLGLSIVKHILDAHGEKINVESKLGEGSTFYFHLKKI
ncbi:histidine kinase [Flavobacteriaceae bacterium UJ101]|nr:histidine kinase [Flavobacteriaceae bacterium UJ101]